DAPLQRQVLGLVDDAEAALADDPGQQEVAQAPAGRERRGGILSLGRVFRLRVQLGTTGARSASPVLRMPRRRPFAASPLARRRACSRGRRSTVCVSHVSIGWAFAKTKPCA